MHGNKIDFDTVRRIALGLSDGEDSTIYGSPDVKVREKLLACIPVRKSAEPVSVAVRIDFDSRVELMAAVPEAYYLTAKRPVAKRTGRKQKDSRPRT